MKKQDFNSSHFVISRTDSIGDVILTLPMAHVLKLNFPDSTISFLGRSYTRDIIECCKSVDNFIDWDEIKIKDSSGAFNKLNIDVFIHVFPVKEIARAVRKAKIPVRIGTSHRLYHLRTCNKLINLGRKKSDLHEAQLNLKMLESLNIQRAYKLDEIAGMYNMEINPELPEAIRSKIDSNKYNLILHPTSKGSAREWGLDNFSQLIDLLPEDKFSIFFTGTKEEGDRIQKDLIEKHPKVHDLTGRLNLRELISFISLSDGLVAASTGPLHISAALGKQAIGIFAPMRPIHPGRWAPIGKKASYLVQEKSCDDCRKINHCDCIASISAESVAAGLPIGTSAK